MAEKKIDKTTKKTPAKSTKAEAKKTVTKKVTPSTSTKKVEVKKETTKKVPAKKETTKKVAVPVEKEEKVVTEVKDTKVTKEMLKKPNKFFNETTKSVAIVVLALALVAVLVALLVTGGKRNEEEADTMQLFSSAMDSKDTEIIYFMSSSCGYCSLETPVLEQISKDYDVEITKIDASKLNSNDADEIVSKLDIQGYTPTIVVVKDGKVVATQEGYLDGHDLVKFFSEAKVLEEGAIYTPDQYLTFVDYKEYEALTNSNSPVIITIGQTACSYCISTRPILSDIVHKYDIEINYFDIRKATSAEQEAFFDLLSKLNYTDPTYVEEGKFGTPLTIVIKDGKIISYVNGLADEATFVKTFTDAGIIK